MASLRIVTSNTEASEPRRAVRIPSTWLLASLALTFFCASCVPGPSPHQPPPTPLEQYVTEPDEAYRYELSSTLPNEGYTAYVVRMTSQRWLTTDRVEDPEWWHWLTIVVPDEVQSRTGLLLITGGNRRQKTPGKAADLIVRAALATNSVTAELRNVPNQSLRFVGDPADPRHEDELIAYGWRKFLEGGANKDDAIWLARLPMTKAAVRAMDTITDFCAQTAGSKVDRFVVAGASKRGWATWTTAVVDPRVVAIVPIVIDLLNVVPSFDHHWQAYGFWAPAVDDYVNEGIMDWLGSPELDSLFAITEPYTYRDRLTLPKYLINATGDQFFLPDSWRFYWDDLVGEKHLRYVPNAGHSLKETDASAGLEAFYHAIVNQRPRPHFEWQASNGALLIETDPNHPPQSVALWQATNPEARDFRVNVLGEVWESSPVALEADGRYRLAVAPPERGWTGFFAEIRFPGTGPEPFIFSTGVVVVPDTLPFPSTIRKE